MHSRPPTVPEVLLAIATAWLALQLWKSSRRERRTLERFRQIQNMAHALAEAGEPQGIAARAHEAVSAIAPLVRFELFFFDEKDSVREVWSWPGEPLDSAPRRVENHPRLGAAAGHTRLSALTAVETPESFVPRDLQMPRRRNVFYRLPLYSGRNLVGYWEIEFHRPLSDAAVAELSAVYRSVTETAAVEKNFRLAARDSLSDLFVRRYFDARLAEEIARSRRSGHPCSLAQFDLDNFKKLNDEHGHAAGDHAIRLFARLLSELIRGHDVCGRRGGEEFAALFPELESSRAAGICERIRRELEARPVRVGDQAVPLTVSAGVAQWQPDEDADHLLARADEALYRAKHEGRNRVVVAESQRPVSPNRIVP